MAKQNAMVNDRQYLIEAALPEFSDTYTVVSHEMIITTVEKLIKEKGFSILKETYKYNGGAQIASGIYYLNHDTDDELGMMFTWTNSYNKAVRFKCFVGAYIKLNNNIIVSNSAKSMFKRKHTGTADTEIELTIQEQLERSIDYYEELIQDKNTMKTMEVPNVKFAEICGRLFMIDNLISSEQVGIIAREFKKPSYTYDCGKSCLWTFYNYILTAVIRCHPDKWVEQQRMVHIWMKNEFNIGIWEEVRTSLTSAPKSKDPVAPEVKELQRVTNMVNNETKVVEALLKTEVTFPVTGEPFTETKEETPSFGRMKFLKEDIWLIDPLAEVGSMVKSDSFLILIEDETDTHFVTVNVEIEEETENNEIVIPIEAFEEFEEIVEESPSEVEIKECVEAIIEQYPITMNKLEDEAPAISLEPETPKFKLPPIKSKSVVTAPVIVPTVVKEEPIQPKSEPKKMTAVMPNLKLKDIKIIPPAQPKLSEKEDDEIRKKISQEILTLYGGLREFTYTHGDGQYNVVLDSDESLCVKK